MTEDKKGELLALVHELRQKRDPMFERPEMHAAMEAAAVELERTGWRRIDDAAMDGKLKWVKRPGPDGFADWLWWDGGMWHWSDGSYMDPAMAHDLLYYPLPPFATPPVESRP